MNNRLNSKVSDPIDHLYPRVNHQVIIRYTRMGTYILSGDSILQADDPTLEVLALCDGTHTIEDIVDEMTHKTRESTQSVHEAVTSLLDTFTAEGILIYSNAHHPVPPVYMYDRPLSVIWEITYACNQNCLYCIAKAGTPDPQELSMEEIDTILNELIDLKVGLINITGGEPLLKKDVALHIARRASDNGISLELLTNGMLITPEVAHQIHEAGIHHAQVSLDCARPAIHDEQRGLPGAWKKTVEGIKNLRTEGVEVIAAAVITRKTLPYLVETRAFLKEIGDIVKTGVVMPMGRGDNSEYLLTPSMYFDFLKAKNVTDDGNQLRDFIFCKETCSIGTNPVITPTGDVYPCMLTKHEALKLGNLRNTTLRTIYASSCLLQELIKWTIDDIEPCRECWNRYYCGGGCRGCAYVYHGSIYGNDVYQCEARKQFAKELLTHGHPVTKRELKSLLALTKKNEEEDDHD